VKGFKYVNTYTDRHGQTRNYFRRSRGEPQIALPAEADSLAFQAAYRAAVAGYRLPPKPRKKNRKQRIEDALSAMIEAFDHMVDQPPRMEDFEAREAAANVLHEIQSRTNLG